MVHKCTHGNTHILRHQHVLVAANLHVLTFPHLVHYLVQAATHHTEVVVGMMARSRDVEVHDGGGGRGVGVMGRQSGMQVGGGGADGREGVQRRYVVGGV